MRYRLSICCKAPQGTINILRKMGDGIHNLFFLPICIDRKLNRMFKSSLSKISRRREWTGGEGLSPAPSCFSHRYFGDREVFPPAFLAWPKGCIPLPKRACPAGAGAAKPAFCLSEFRRFSRPAGRFCRPNAACAPPVHKSITIAHSWRANGQKNGRCILYNQVRRIDK